MVTTCFIFSTTMIVTCLIATSVAKCESVTKNCIEEPYVRRQNYNFDTLVRIFTMFMVIYIAVELSETSYKIDELRNEKCNNLYQETLTQVAHVDDDYIIGGFN